MSELCKLWLVNQTGINPRCARGLGLAIKGIRREPGAVEVLCVLIESASASWGTRFQCYQTVPVGEPGEGCMRSPCAISYNCTGIYKALQVKSSMKKYNSYSQTENKLMSIKGEIGERDKLEIWD